MLIWLDDQLGDPELPGREVPQGHVGCRTALEAIRLLRRGQVTHLDFDHDLGRCFDGCTVAKYIEKGAQQGTIPPLTWTIHSANPVGAARIQAVMLSAERFWSREPRNP